MALLYLPCTQVLGAHYLISVNAIPLWTTDVMTGEQAGDAYRDRWLEARAAKVKKAVAVATASIATAAAIANATGGETGTNVAAYLVKEEKAIDTISAMAYTFREANCPMEPMTTIGLYRLT